MSSNSLKWVCFILLILAIANVAIFRTVTSSFYSMSLTLLVILFDRYLEKTKKDEREAARDADLKKRTREFFYIIRDLSAIGFKSDGETSAVREAGSIEVKVTGPKGTAIFKKPQFHPEDCYDGRLWVLDDEKEPLNQKMAIFFPTPLSDEGLVFYKD